MDPQDQIPGYVLEGLAAVRASGITNMMARTRVLVALDTLEASEAFLWLIEHPTDYLAALTAMGVRRQQ